MVLWTIPVKVDLQFPPLQRHPTSSVPSTLLLLSRTPHKRYFKFILPLSDLTFQSSTRNRYKCPTPSLWVSLSPQRLILSSYWSLESSLLFVVPILLFLLGLMLSSRLVNGNFCLPLSLQETTTPIQMSITPPIPRVFNSLCAGYQNKRVTSFYVSLGVFFTYSHPQFILRIFLVFSTLIRNFLSSLSSLLYLISCHEFRVHFKRS